MAHYISVLVSQEDNKEDWVYAQQAESLTALESKTIYDGINRMPRNLFTGQRANNKIRIIKDNYGVGSIKVVSYKGTLNALTTIAYSSRPATISLLKKVMNFEKKTNK